MEDYYSNILKRIAQSKLDIKKRELKNGSQLLIFLFISQLTDKNMLSNDVVKPISIYISQKNPCVLNASEISDSIIYGSDFVLDDDEAKILDYILQGMVVILLSNERQYIVVNLREVQKRSIEDPELTFTIRGPRDSFNENLDDNLSLVRYRIKDPNLSIDTHEVGRRTRTSIAILYIGDIVNDDIVEDLTSRIKGIDVDGIISSGEIQNLILNKPRNLFPQMGIIERSDMAVGALLEGKVVVLVEGSGLAIVAPKLFSEFFVSCDDFYDNKFIAILAKWVRIYSTLLSITITALYVAILSFHIDTIPVDFINIINDAQQGVPFTVFVGAIIIEMIVEMLREALLRVPKQIGSAVGIVGGIVIGQAAIAAKIFSPLLLIVVSISLLSSFTASDYSIMNALRIVKFLLIIVSGCFGLIGFTLTASIVLMNIVSTSSFGIPYFAPFAPFNLKDFISTFYYGKDISRLRPNFLRTKDNTRSNNNKQRQ